jgi:hypothetical protein
LQKTIEEEQNHNADINSPRIYTTPNQPLPSNTLNVEQNYGESFDADEPPATPREEPPDRSHLYMEREEPVVKSVTRNGVEHRSNGSPPSALNSILPPVGEPTINREQTNLSSTRSRNTHPPNHTFDKPSIGALENVSAISLDEFWSP